MQFLGFNQTRGSSCILPAHGCGGARARINESAAKNPPAQARTARQGGSRGECRAVRAEAKPRRLLYQSRAPQKSFLFLFGEKIWRAQNQNRNENFFAGWRALASGGGAERQFRSKKVRAFSNKGHQM